jgi:hypothetical protein
MTRSIVRTMLSILLGCGLVAAIAALISVQQTTASSINRGYVVDSSVQVSVGSAVSIAQASSEGEDIPQFVEPTRRSNADRFVGIVSTLDNASITITQPRATIYVATSGSVDALVSDIGGNIQRGDLLIASPLDGVLMRASSEISGEKVIAIALADTQEDQLQEQQVSTEDGGTITVQIGMVPVEIYSGPAQQTSSDAALAAVGRSITGRPVSSVRVLIAAIILFVVLVVVGAIVYGSVVSTVTAIGRNPLAKRAIYKQLLQTTLLAVVILFAGGLGVYVVIWT